ncbi:ChaB-like [Alphabaculovirus myunipunctae]|uniref:ChaB-like n=1 Tax=Mythimna unipuncta nucleopolyhedrovirus TaxID=447897 RepID=A0A2K9VSD5_9ABAC|nr:ChaB-like [Mythimna unipuncta nucleopolyhedrovirus]AUV65375.1 ChaB-like [Mythimna unipuncta nucleopolyhedrovirus]
MFHLNESFYKQEMPARAKRLFVKTFKKYHKLDGGDEDVALHMARQAVDREYVKLNDRWIPKSAAEEIVRHDIDEDTDTEDDDDRVVLTPQSAAAAATPALPLAAATAATVVKKRKRRRYESLSDSGDDCSSEEDGVCAIDDDDDDDDDDEDDDYISEDEKQRDVGGFRRKNKITFK